MENAKAAGTFDSWIPEICKEGENKEKLGNTFNHIYI